MAYIKAFIKDAPFGVSVIFIILAIGFVYIAAPVFGNSALIVRSGSMQPAVLVGDLVLTRAQKNLPYKVGDIISFKSQDKIISHRILGLKNQNGKIFYRTKGDANKNGDPNLVAESEILGKAYFRLPYLGKLIAFTKTQAGFALAVIFPALLVILFEIQNIFKEVKKQKTLLPETQKQSEYPVVTPIIEVVNFSGFSNRHKLGFRMPGLKILLPILASTLLVYSSFAFFSNTATSTNNTFIAAESFGVNQGDVVINELMWMGSTKGASDEWIELRNMTNKTIGIDGWQITKWVPAGGGSEQLMLTIPAGKTIPPNGFFLIAQVPSGDPGTALNVDPNHITTSITLHNDNLQVRLFVNNWNSGGLLVDTAGNKSNPLAGEHKVSTPKRFYSMERNDEPGAGTIADSWHTATLSTGFDSGEDIENRGTPKSANSPP